MMSNVGNPQVYEANEQRPNPGDNAPGRFEGGQPNSHGLYDSKDERTNPNKIAQAEKAATEEDENSKTVTDPLAPARAHGNEPSHGAKVDAEIMKDEEEELRRKGKI